MKAELAVALIAGAIGLTAAGSTVWSTVRSFDINDRNTKAIEALKVEISKANVDEHKTTEISRYNEPLTRATYDLQSRFYNIVRQGLVNSYIQNGTPREKSYVVENTTFLIAQYMCWTEIFRREVSLTDLSDSPAVRKILKTQDDIYALWSTDQFSPVLRIFAGEQRALGEALVVDGPKGPECMGYGKYLNTFKVGANPLVDAIRTDVENLPANKDRVTERIARLQNFLVDLLSVLDPEYLRFPPDRRTKV